MKTKKTWKTGIALTLAAGLLFGGTAPASAADYTFGVVGNTKPACMARFDALIKNAHARGDAIIQYRTCMRLGNLWSASIVVRR